jgi:hypothetical protein
LYKENEKGHPIKNILGAGKETIPPPLQRILNKEFRIQAVGKVKPLYDKEVKETIQ